MWSRLIRWRGIVFRLHPLFVLLMLVSVATGRFLELTTLFLIVLWHELGHLFMALRFGWKVREIKLLPFGGVVEVEEAGTLPAKEEALVALAGPAQNAILAAVAALLGQAGWLDAGWTSDFVRANALIASFNLLPIWPLDGGKLLQAGLSLVEPYYRALVHCARISLAGSCAVVASSAYPLAAGGGVHLNLLVVGLFLLVSNWNYRRNLSFVFLRFLVHRGRSSESRANDGALSRPIVVGEDRPLVQIVRLIMKEQYHLVYVMKHGRIARVVPEEAVIDGFLSLAKA